MARSGSRKERERRERRATSGKTPPLSDPELTALHEVGHAVVAHALGRTPTYARVTYRRLPVGHPHNPYPYPLDSAGYHVSEPLLASEVYAHLKSGEPLAPEHVEWLWQEAVITLAGPIAEGNQHGPEIQGDLHDVSQIAGLL